MYESLIRLLAAIGRAAAKLPFPITGLTAALLAGLMLARPKKLWKPLLALALSLAVLWLPLYANKPYAVSRTAADETISTFIESLAHALEPAEALSHEEILQTAQTLSGGGVHLKYMRFPELMRSLRMAGFYSPLTGEALLSEAEPEWFLPFVACHELAHANGLANEGQANLRAYALCMAADSPAFRIPRGCTPCESRFRCSIQPPHSDAEPASGSRSALPFRRGTPLSPARRQSSLRHSGSI